jgi:hypothetical protein
MVLSLILGVLGTPVLAGNTEENVSPDKTIKIEKKSDENFTEVQIKEINKKLNDKEFQEDVAFGASLAKYVDASGDFIVFNHEAALNDGVDSVLVNEIKTDYDKANEYLATQQSSQLTKSSNTFQIAAAKAKCSGAHKYVGNIVAGTTYINSCNTNKIIGILATGGGVATAAAFIPVPGAGVSFGVATAVLAIGVGVFTYNAANGNGVKIRILKNPITKKIYPYWIKPQ